MLIKSEGLPDIILGARKFKNPRDVVAAVLLARKEGSSSQFISALKKNLDPKLYQVESDFTGNRVTIKSLDTSMKVGNEDERLFKTELNK